MAWKALDRISPAADDGAQPVLDEAVKEKIRAFFPRYPSRRAVLLPALHVVQNALGYVSHRAMRDIAELLEIPPAQVLDTVTFYTHFWTHPKGAKTIVSCRSLSCELMGAREVNEEIKRQLGVEEHGTTADGKYSFVTEECLGACEAGPCLLINEKLHKCVKREDVARLLADPKNDEIDVPRSTLYDGPTQAERKAAAAGAARDRGRNGDGRTDDHGADAALGTTSDVQEMREA
ncbi:MAG: NAD(P)H-dependent oxidoreductase subunit E [Phycisphaerae bacterium]|jgi:NADH-quinone oxidoreductase subunit E